MTILPDGASPTTPYRKPFKSSLYEAVREYNGKGFYPFHMPGHKGNLISCEDMLSYDLTELPGLDNLHQPRGVIEEAQQKAARLFGAEESFFLVNGATSGIIAALGALGSEETVLAARNSHRSFYSGLVFSGARAEYLYPALTPEGLPGGILLQDVEEALHTNKNIKAVFVVSPTYEGFTSDLKEIAALVHRYHKLLIVDEAHGAHFTFHPAFPDGALKAGADIVIQSLHKTLPALTQSAILHVQGERADRGRLKAMLSMCQTSSPSYLLMAMMSRCVDLLEAEAKGLFENYAAMLGDFRASFDGKGRLRLLGKELAGNYGIEDIDPGKLTFFIEAGLTGEGLRTRLGEAGIQVEMSGLKHIIAMTSTCDQAGGFTLLKKSLEEIAETLTYEALPLAKGCPFLPRAQPVMTPRQAFYAAQESVPFQESRECIAGEFMIPYPPGIPLVAPGERITGHVIEKIMAYCEAGIPVLGQKEEGKIQIIRDWHSHKKERLYCVKRKTVF